MKEFLLKAKNILFKFNMFKEVMSNLVFFPGFSMGFFGAELFRDVPRVSPAICYVVVTIGLLWACWIVAYIHFKHKARKEEILKFMEDLEKRKGV
jgi:hypothetical protein